jgi:hypothetical protein
MHENCIYFKKINNQYAKVFGIEKSEIIVTENRMIVEN